MWPFGCFRKPPTHCRRHGNTQHTHTHTRTWLTREVRGQEEAHRRCLPRGTTDLDAERDQMLKHGTRVRAIRWIALSLSLDRLSVSRQQLPVERKNLAWVVRHGMNVCVCVCEEPGDSKVLRGATFSASTNTFLTFDWCHEQYYGC